MRIPNPIINYIAESAIVKFRIVCFGAADGVVKQSSAATDFMIGVVEGFSYVAGDRPDVVRGGPAEVEYGAAVTRGQPLTSDALGRAIPAAPAAGANMRIIGYAEVSGVQGDIGSVYVGAETIQG